MFAFRNGTVFTCYSALSAFALTACLTEADVPTEDDSAPESDVVREVLGFKERFGNATGFDATYGLGAAASLSGGPLLGGLASADVDLNGADDVLVLGGNRASRLLFNTGKGTFEAAVQLPQFDELAAGPAFADIDLDGDPDLLVPSAGDGSVAVYPNDDGSLKASLQDTGLEGDFASAFGVVAGDIDGDTDLDLFVVRALSPRATAASGVLWINNGEGHFSDQSSALADVAVQGATSALMIDIDQDARLDLVLTRSDGVTVLQNQTEVPKQLHFAVSDLSEVPDLDNAFSVAATDLDNDRDIDLILSGVGGMQSHVTPEPEALDAGVSEDGGADASASEAADAGTSSQQALSVTLGAEGKNVIIGNDDAEWIPWGEDLGLDGLAGAAFCVADFDNDGYQDVFQGHSSRSSTASRDEDAATIALAPSLYLQAGPENGGGFVDGLGHTDLHDVQDARSVLCFDYDADGDVDILLSPFVGAVRLFENTMDPELGSGNYLGVRVRGSEQHPSTLGAEVTIVTGALIQTRHIGQSRTSANQAPDLLHFGLGSTTLIDGLIITWPDGAEETVLENLAVNATYTLTRQSD